MTISYTLHLASDARPEDATRALKPLVSKAPSGTAEKPAPPGMSWPADGPVTITARPLTWLPAVAEENGVAAKLAIYFDLIAEESEEAKPVMLRDLQALLQRLPGDAMFHDLGDETVLRRRAGKLELNLANALWSPELLALVTVPHDARRF
jgi:hypothetical protein